MRKKTGLYVLKYTLYALILLLLYVLQSTPGLFAIGGVKPNLLIPAVVMIAMREGEFIGGIYGAFAGLFCDLGMLVLFGFNGIIFLVCAVAVGLLCIYLVRKTLLNAVWLTAAVAALQQLLYYFFSYGIWNYENTQILLLHRIIPSILYTAALAPLYYWFWKGLCRRFAEKMEE